MYCVVPDCNTPVDFFSGKKCKFCEKSYCFDHIQLENHDCIKTTPTKFIRKTWLRKYDVNVSSGRYIIVCDECGFRTTIGTLIDVANEERIYHINNSNCDSSKVFLEGVN